MVTARVPPNNGNAKGCDLENDSLFDWYPEMFIGDWLYLFLSAFAG